MDLLALFLGKRGPPCEHIDRHLHVPLNQYPIWVWKHSVRNWDLEVSKIPNIGEVDRIYMTSPQGLIGCKTKPRDYILMFCSADVPGTTYKINSGTFCPSFLKQSI